MTTTDQLREQLIALHAKYDHAHRRLLDALAAADLRTIVEATREQAAVCCEQGAALAEFVAHVAPERLGLNDMDRHRMQELARHLRSSRPS